MKNYKAKLLALSLVTLLVSCKNEKKETADAEVTSPKQEQVSPPTENNNYATQTVNDELAQKVKDYINTKYLTKNDINAISPEEKKFQMYQIDLNNDGKNEVFVNFMTTYFCGSGGCNILLLSSDVEKITNFTVMQTPLYVDNAVKNGWKILNIRSEGKLKELSFKNGTYPSNPSMAPDATNNEPSKEAQVLFGEGNNAKTYDF